jgi:hypothetical protein
MTGAICWLSAARLACMVCAASLAAKPCDEDDDVAEDVVGAESSAPQPVNAALNAKVAHATTAALARRLSLLIFASIFV